jgi:hypothetical protein
MKRNTSMTTGDAAGDLITNHLNLSVARRSPNRRKARGKITRDRAAFWFDQMRKAVNAAREWRPAPAPRPQQTYINLQPTNP